MNVLLFGSTGLLGKDVEKTLIKHGISVYAPTRFELQAWYGIFTYDWMHGEIPRERQLSRIEYLLTSKQIDFVINCIGFTNVDNAEERYEEAAELNCDFPAHLAKATDKHSIGFLHVSTDYVFGNSGSNSTMFVETDSMNPVNKYGQSKEIGEIYIEGANSDAYIVRTAWLFGAAKKTWIDLAIDGKYIDIYKENFGSPSYSVDVAEAIVAIVEQRPKPGVYHVVNECQEPMTKFELMHFVAHLVGLGGNMQEIKATNLKAPRPKNTALNCDKISSVYKMPSVFGAAERYLKEIGKI